MRLCLFEDRRVIDLEPLALTRPAFALLCGITSLAAKQQRLLPDAPAGFLVRPCLADVVRQDHPETPVNDLAWLRADHATLVNARWLPPAGLRIDTRQPVVGVVGKEVAYAVLPPERLEYCSLNTLDDCLATWKATLPNVPVGGYLARYPWDLVHRNAAEIVLDWEAADRPDAGTRPDVAVVGPPELLAIHPSAEIDPMVVADTRGGPVVVGAGAVVAAFTRLEGPCVVGPCAQVLGAKVRPGTTLGPECRVGGEVEASILQGHVNKYHDGFLGHSYVGEWVNFGAGTHTSDLRNDYAEVRVPVRGELVRTGQAKVGCFLGDHTKTGLATLFNTGTSAGAFCDLLPGGLLPKYLPSFASWWKGGLADRAELDGLMQTAEEVMRRRGRELTPAHAVLYARLFKETAAERRRAIQDAEIRRLRRSA